MKFYNEIHKDKPAKWYYYLMEQKNKNLDNNKPKKTKIGAQ
jgi:hypothetical protein